MHLLYVMDTTCESMSSDSLTVVYTGMLSS